MAYGVVYLMRNTVNGKLYVGQTTRTIEERFKEHAQAPTYIGNSMRFHGVDKFTIEVIAECETQEELDACEIHYIAEYDCLAPKGYNCTTGGGNGSPCEETVEKLRASANEYYEKHPEARDRISEANIQRFSAPEERAKQAERTRKSFEDPERAAKHSESQKKRFERQEERDKISAAVTERFSDPAERDAQSERITAYFNTPGAREKNGAAQKKRFERQEERDKVAAGVNKYYAEHGGRKQSDESKDKIRVKRLAYFARLRREKVAGENQSAVDWNVSLQDLKKFLAKTPIKPHSTDDKKALSAARRAAKLLAKVAEQNKAAANLKLPNKLPLPRNS